MPGRRILVVDTDPEVRRCVGEALEAEGYSVEHSETGPEALASIELAAPAAIVVDLMMPGSHGNQFLTSLRREMGLADIPVLVMTEMTGIAVEQALSMGASDVINKPIDCEEVLNKLALALFRARRGQRSLTEEYVLEQLSQLIGQEPLAVVGVEPREPEGVVLIVDSDRSTMKHFDELLSAQGYTVVSLTRVTEELTRLSRVLEPRAILVNLHLPGVDGMTALRRLRAESVLDKVPVLLFSDDLVALEESREEIASLHAELAPKPLADEVLLAFISIPPPSSHR